MILPVPRTQSLHPLHSYLPVGSILVLMLSGCVRTGIVNELTSRVPEAPFHRILVCSFGGDRDQEHHLESQLAARLRKHKVSAQTCDDVLLSTASVDDIATTLEVEYDAVLITRREPRPEPNPKDVHGLESVLLAPRAASNLTPAERHEDFPRPADLDQFIRMFVDNRGINNAPNPSATNRSEETILEPYGEERFIYGATDLISVRGNRLVWSLGGYVAGTRHQSASKLVKALAQRIVGELDSSDLIP